MCYKYLGAITLYEIETNYFSCWYKMSWSCLETIIVFLHVSHPDTLIPHIKLVLQAVYHQIMRSSTKICVNSCPSNYFKNNSDLLCYALCPSGSYNDTTTNTCVSSCATNNYWYDLNRSCESTCLSQFFPDKVNNIFVRSCLLG